MTERVWTWWSQITQWKVRKEVEEIITVAPVECATFLSCDKKFKLRAKLLLSDQDSPE